MQWTIGRRAMLSLACAFLLGGCGGKDQQDGEPLPPERSTTAYSCGEQTVQVSRSGDRLSLKIDDRSYALSRVESASGARYESRAEPGLSFWEKGESAMLTLQGRRLPECMRQSDNAPGPEASAAGTFAAHGSEPGWALRVEGGQLNLEWDYGEQRLTLPRTAPSETPQGRVYSGQTEHGALRIGISDELCRDAATGMPYPATVEVEIGDQRLNGCGGAPESLLLGAPWIVEDIANAGIIDRSHISLEFTADGSLNGLAGCNRYQGAYGVTGEGLATGSFATTRKACPPALMNQEQRFLELIQQVRRFSFSDTGALLLTTGAGEVITARRR